ncbi:putative ABC1 family beta-lactamase [Neospora caninum Liverpool]|uniref:ABC1 family beta-lactamase, putative n=1 Tax=Neospora caninum (strain Liverpool) TaxID=572307 RepID=F0VQB6_NEOCL|nr:putative ABC1 family beta-lactamase [Neospora caninum Liverpool]CBZ55913.1 putative ABC1 family beta-lactamase [Neospora caninum Liverpool]CEL70656.1 TPA: ABC1 family beta-lactamase, putative [Neospora caninum Liverpool]|eukprot:XP_003885939.1 putative ABC1 family beta-lactamase [Neospora caninum Liverpool]
MEQWNRKWRTLWCWSNVYVGWKVSQARARALPKEAQAEFWEQRHEHFANVIWENIKELRGWWVKVGQFMSTRSDLLPQQYIHHLVKLQDMMPTSDFASIRKTIADELGDVDAIFEKIDPNALASASIGQVHRAWLKDGSPVVVKVQHADVETLLSHDMQNLKQLSWAFGLLESGLNFAPILEEWQKAAAKELDFRYELVHQLRAYEGLRKSGIDVKIPKPYPEFTAKKVMVMEFVNGFKITDTEKLDAYKVDRRELMFKLCDSFAYQIHIDGLFNGDPHPGNILVEVNEATGEATPIILDWGLVKEFDSAGQLAFSKLVYAVASMNVMGLMEAFEDMGFKFKEGAGAVIDPEVYMDALRIALRDGEVEKEETEALKQSAGQTLGAAQKAGLNRKKLQEKNPLEDWPRDIIFFVRVASLLHGLCVQLNVHLPFLQIMVKRAQECLFERYVPPSPLVYVKLGRPSRPRTQLEGRVDRLLRSLFQRGLLLGCQVAVVKDGALLVDTCIGKMGPVDARPVTSDSLFCGYCVSKGLLTTALLKLVSDGEVHLDDLVSNWWDGFIRYGKKNVTIRQLLSHRAGLHRALPANLTLSKLTDYAAMVGVIEDAPPATVPGLVGRYAYLTYGWAVSELVASVACSPVEDYIREKMLQPYGLENSIFLPLPEDGLLAERPEPATETEGREAAPKDATPPTASEPGAAAPSAEDTRDTKPTEQAAGTPSAVSAVSAVSAFSSFTKSLASGQQLLTERLGQKFLTQRREEDASSAKPASGEDAGDAGHPEPRDGSEGDAGPCSSEDAGDTAGSESPGVPGRPGACRLSREGPDVCVSAPSTPGNCGAAAAADEGRPHLARSAPPSVCGTPLGSPRTQSVASEGSRDPPEDSSAPHKTDPFPSHPVAAFSRRVSAFASSVRSFLRPKRTSSEQSGGRLASPGAETRRRGAAKSGGFPTAGLGAPDRARVRETVGSVADQQNKKRGRRLSVILHAPDAASPDSEAGSVLLYEGEPGESREASLTENLPNQAALDPKRDKAVRMYRRETSACTVDSSVASTATKAGVLEDESDRRSAYYSVSSEEPESCCCCLSPRRPSSDSRAGLVEADTSATGGCAPSQQTVSSSDNSWTETAAREEPCGYMRVNVDVEGAGRRKVSEPRGATVGPPSLGPPASHTAHSSADKEPSRSQHPPPSSASTPSSPPSSAVSSPPSSSPSPLPAHAGSGETSLKDSVESRARFPPGVCTVTAKTPLFWRITSARRRISFGNVTQQEVMEKLEAAKKYAEAQAGEKSAEEPKAASDLARRRQRLHKERAMQKLRRARNAGAGAVWRREDAERAWGGEERARETRRRRSSRRQRRDSSSGPGRGESEDRGLYPSTKDGSEESPCASLGDAFERRRSKDEEDRGREKLASRGSRLSLSGGLARRGLRSASQSKGSDCRQASLLSPASALSALSSRGSSRRGSSSGRSAASPEDLERRGSLVSAGSPSLSGEKRAPAQRSGGSASTPLSPVSLSPGQGGDAPVHRVSALDLIRKKPHVMDPLLYDSRRIVSKRVPPTNGRFTACGLAQLYAAIAAGEVIDGPTMDAARTPATVDDSLETLLLTGGGSRVWGLGYQLYECAKVDSNQLALPPPPSPASLMRLRAAQSFTRRQSVHPSSAVAAARMLRRQFTGDREFPAGSLSPFSPGGAVSPGRGPSAEGSGDGASAHAGVGGRSPRTLSPGPGKKEERTVTGFGHGDFGGSVALCFPELKLSIAILVNDVLTGPQASREILEFLLRKFGLEPRWTTAVDFDEVLANLTPKQKRSSK